MKKIYFEFINWGEFEKFLENLPNDEAANLLSLLVKIQEQGITTSIKMKWIKKLRSTKNLYEIRSNWRNNIQRVIYFKVSKDRYIITHGFTKKDQKTPLKEIRKAELRKSKFMKDDNGHG